MKLVNLTQRTDVWLEWKSQGVGASESASIIGMSRYKTVYKLWQDKTDRSFPELINDDMQRGIDLEDEARGLFERKVGECFIPICGERDNFPIMQASFDGVSENMKKFVEIKCPRTDKLFNIVATNDIKRLKNEYPEYWVQVQHQYGVNDHATNGYFAVYYMGSLEYMEVPRDDEFIESLVFEIGNFWKYVTDDKEPKMVAKDYNHSNDREDVLNAQEFIYVTNSMKDLKIREKELRERLKPSGEHSMIIGDILKITRCSPKESYDYKQACIDNEIDLEKYRKDGSVSYRFTEL